MPKIILINDDAGVRETFELYSEMLGHEPVVVDPSACNVLSANGQECTKDEACADILVVDQRFPGTTGLDFVQLQSDKGCRLAAQCKSVVSSSLTNAEFRQAKRIGCHVLQKPVVFEIFED